MGTGNGRILVVLDCLNFMEVQMKRELCHDGGSMLRFLFDRLSIPRMYWEHTYAYRGQKKEIPTRKKERWSFLTTAMLDLDRFIQQRRDTPTRSNVEVLAMGRLACECLVGSSAIGKKAGTCWKPRREWSESGFKRVWVSFSPEAALFDPGVAVSITGTIAAVAKATGFVVATKSHKEVPMFDWSEFL